MLRPYAPLVSTFTEDPRQVERLLATRTNWLIMSWRIASDSVRTYWPCPRQALVKVALTQTGIFFHPSISHPLALELRKAWATVDKRETFSLSWLEQLRLLLNFKQFKSKSIYKYNYNYIYNRKAVKGQ